ncbi:MAG TPA: hypothetical protein VF711_09305, partial [Acidimicrobiales bacterium]
WNGYMTCTAPGSTTSSSLTPPPTRNALDFLAAPDRMVEFFSSRLLRWLTGPARSRVLNLASRPFYHAADRLLGSQFLEDVAEFFLNFQTMYPGFVERARAVERLFHDRRTTFLIVTTLEAAPLHEAEFFIDAMAQRKFHLGALVLNKVLPAYLLAPQTVRLAERLAADAPLIAAGVPAAGAPDDIARVLREISQSFLNFEVVAKREAELRAELASTPDVVASVPYFDTDITDLAGLVDLGQHFWSG